MFFSQQYCGISRSCYVYLMPVGSRAKFLFEESLGGIFNKAQYLFSTVSRGMWVTYHSYIKFVVVDPRRGEVTSIYKLLCIAVGTLVCYPVTPQSTAVKFQIQYLYLEFYIYFFTSISPCFFIRRQNCTWLSKQSLFNVLLKVDLNTSAEIFSWNNKLHEIANNYSLGDNK